jgi:transglutaminase-like putative cysteine protease
MYYNIQHVTKYRYNAPIYESVMQIYMQPRTENLQHCFSFEVTTTPRSRPTPYRDYLGNTAHSFNIPGYHSTLTITARSVVEVQAPPLLPDALSPHAWDELDALVATADYWDALSQTALTEPTQLSHSLADEIDARRRDDPLTVIRQVNARLYEYMAYVPLATRVDSPIDEALANRAGVCQDFSHILLSLLRDIGIPCRYVSGYIAHQQGIDRAAADASHAWVEVLLPRLGWIGFDPTNNVITGDHHVRVAIGRDYTDVPPTRGVFKGDATSELSVAVQVTRIEDPATILELKMPPSASQWQSMGDQSESTSGDQAAQSQHQQQ